MPKRSGRKSASQTPAPKKDRIYGSKKNPKGSAESEKTAKEIKLSPDIMASLLRKLKEFKADNPDVKTITIADLKAVYRRGLGAYSSTHRPTISGGKPNTRNAWAMARVNKFLKKASGEKVKKAYVQDDDLMKFNGGGKLKYNVVKEEQRLGILPMEETHKYLKSKYKSYKKKNAELDDLPSIYIRAGLPKIKRDGTFDVSKNGDTGKREKGVSVFNAKYSPNSDFVFVDLVGGVGYDINLSYRDSQYTEGSDYDKKGEYFNSLKNYDNYERKMYLLDGDKVGYGSDGEPLLDNKTIKVIGILIPNKVVPPKSFLKEYMGGFNVFFGGDKFQDYPKYKKGGSTLLAPNGKPSNLTPEQWHLVRTPKFKEWFGDWQNDPENASKVVDENGEPLVVYHASPKKFTIFGKKESKHGLFHFGTIGQAIQRLIHFIETEGFSLSSFLSIEQEEEVYENDIIWLVVYYILLKNYFSDDKHKEYFDKYFQNKGISETKVTLIKSLNINLDRSLIDKELGKFNINPYFLYVSNLGETSDVAEDWQLDNDFYDGYEYLNEFEGNKEEFSYIVFNPEQIKLADGSNTTFDGSNPDIRYDGGGEVDALINDGIVELKMHDTKPEHAKLYGVDAERPLYIQSIIVSEEYRGKGIGSKVMKYIVDYAIKNQHDVIFGHITQHAEPSIDVIKSMLVKSGFNTCEDNNDFYKIISNNDLTDYAKGGSTKLLAPNGKRSNLTPEQWHLVRTPKFKAWFGDWENDPENASKVVDWNGEPLIVWHGSDTKFNRFIKAFQGSKVGRKINGFYFTDLEDVAYTYTYDDDKEKYMGKKYVRPFFLNIRKMKTHDLSTKFGDPVFWNDIYDDLISNAKDKYDGVLLKNIIDILQENVKDKEDYDYWGNTYVVFDSNNIKLADGRNTTFDGSNPDIRYDGGGGVTHKYNNFVSNENIVIEQTKIGKNYRFEFKYVIPANDGSSKRSISKFIVTNDVITSLSDIKSGENVFEIRLIHVNKEYRGKGIANQMIRSIKEWASNNGVDWLISLINVHDSSDLSNEQTLAFFEKHGFEYLDTKYNSSIVGIKLNQFRSGGATFNDAELLKKYKRGESIGFTAIAHLKAKGLIPRADGTKRKSEKYKYNGGGETGQNIKCVRCGWEWNTLDSDEHDKYVCHKCNFDNRTFYDADPIGYDGGGGVDDDNHHHSDTMSTLSDKLLEEGWLSDDKRYILSHENKIDFRNKAQDDAPSMKPKGLWYAIGDGWAKFLAYEMPQWSKNANNLHEIEVTDRVLKIKTIQEAIDFTEKYKSEKNEDAYDRRIISYIDWKRVAKDWSGIEVIDPYNWSRATEQTDGRISFIHSMWWLYSWDVPSGCVWNEDGIKKITPIITDFQHDTDFNNGGETKTNNMKTLVIFEDRPNEILEGKLGFKDIFDMYGVMPTDIQHIETKEGKLSDSFLNWSNKYVMKNFGSAFDEGYPVYMQEIDSDGNEVITNASGQLEDGTWVEFDANDVSWHEKRYHSGGVTNRYEISDYYDADKFGGGGDVKTKNIITQKIGYSEDIADYLIGLSPKLAVWIADSIMKADIQGYKEEQERRGLPFVMSDAKKEVLSQYSNASQFRNYYQRDIRKILDWLQHPITEKQNLRELGFNEAIEKSEQFHEELKVIGGDIDYTEPEENEIIIRYPKDKDGAEYYWVHIPSNFCNLESSRMGHCGRTGHGNTLISLRSVRPYGKGHTINDSHVTIAYNEDEGVFYQIKGKKNQKPSEKYHPYIFDLIKYLLNIDRHDKIQNIENEIEEINLYKKDLNKRYDNYTSEIQKLTTELAELNDALKNSDYDKEINELQVEIKNIRDEIQARVNTQKIIRDTIVNRRCLLEKKYNDIRRMNRYGFNGFRSEYESSEDYGYDDMTKEELSELYELRPELFSGFAGELALYQKGITDKKPNTIFTIEKDAKYVSDLLEVDWDIRDDLIETILSGDTYDLYEHDFYSDRYVLEHLYPNLNKENIERVEQEISSITSLPLETIKENGAEYYLSGDYLDESDENYDFDSIFNAINRAEETATSNNYYNYLYGTLKKALSELGEIEYLNSDGVKINVDLLNVMSLNELSSLSKEYDTDDLETLFLEWAGQSGDVLPNFSIDDRYSPYASSKEFNEIFAETDFYMSGGMTDNQKFLKKFISGKIDSDKEKFIMKFLKDVHVDIKNTPFRPLKGLIIQANRNYENERLKKLPHIKYVITYLHPFGGTYTTSVFARSSNEARAEFRKYHGKYHNGKSDKILSVTLSKDNKKLAKGGMTDDDKKETYEKWKSLVNMSHSELKRFYNSKEGKIAGLTPQQAKEAGIDSGRESARWIMRMKKTPVSNWTPNMWKWAKKQISFVSRMSGNKGKLYDENGNKTRKYLSLLIWGNDPEKYGGGGVAETELQDVAIFYQDKGDFMFPKGLMYGWLYDVPDAESKLESGEYDFVLFPFGGSMFGRSRQTPPLLKVWNKSYQKDKKGSEHLIGIVRGFHNEEEGILYIQMMTTRKDWRRRGVNFKIVKAMRDYLNLDKDKVVFEDTTMEGKKFEVSGKYLDGGLIAPNGKPSNLTFGQYRLVRTQKFKEWFGDWENDPENASKVMDENGEPLVVYHGSKSKFHEFDKTKIGSRYGIDKKTFHFTNSEYISKLYGMNGYDYGVFLRLKEPHKIQILTPDPIWEWDSNYDIIMKKIKNKDGIIIESIAKYEHENFGGHGQNKKHIIVFEPNQIKLADGSNTTFDGSNPDIRYDGGGGLDEDYFIAICNYAGYLPNLRNYNTEKHEKLSDAFDTLFDYMKSEEGVSYMSREGCFFSIEKVSFKNNEQVGKVMYKITGKDALKLHNRGMLKYGGSTPKFRNGGGNVTFSDRYDKKKWVQINNHDLYDFKEEIFDLIDKTYSNIGGNLEIRNSLDLANTDLDIWFADDIDEDPYVDAVVGGKRTKSGVKLTTMAQDGERMSKIVLLKKVKELIKQDGFYAETTKDIADALNVPIITDRRIITEVVNKPDISFNPDGSYNRSIKGRMATKVLVGALNYAKGGGTPKFRVKVSEGLSQESLNEMKRMSLEKLAWYKQRGWTKQELKEGKKFLPKFIDEYYDKVYSNKYDGGGLTINNKKSNDEKFINESQSGFGEGKGTTTEVRYNGRDALSNEGRNQSDKNDARRIAKEKIKHPETNISLKSANDYNRMVGLPQVTQHKYKKSDAVMQKGISDMYDKMVSIQKSGKTETDLEKKIYREYKRLYPEIFRDYKIKNYKDLVRKAYNQLIHEVQLQYENLPIKVSYHEGTKNYENSAEMLDDVHNFGHIWVYKGGDDHPTLGSATMDSEGLTANDKFRAVHDFYGHSVEGYEFGRNGEENAWIEHSKMFSPLAQWALSSETRGQNSFVNYSGVNDEILDTISVGSRLKKEGLKANNESMIKEGQALLDTVYDNFKFAEQKAIILPPEYTTTAFYHNTVIDAMPEKLNLGNK